MNASTPHPASMDVQQLLGDCEIRRGRRSGPGGQHRNKVETAIVVTHLPTGVKGTATERRSQEQNRQVAIFRLRLNLALNVRVARSTGNTPSDLWQSRCVGNRLKVSSTHDDFPSLLAEALDVIEAHNWDVREAAEALGITASQLIKFLKIEPSALAKVNEHRRGLSLRPLR